MPNGNMTTEEFYKSLSEDDWDKAEAVEAELAKLLEEGLTEDVAVKFVRTVMTVRQAVPAATVGGIFDQALSAGLGYFLDERTLAKMRGAGRIGEGRIKEPAKRKLKSTLK